MPRLLFGRRLAPGARTILALTCQTCGQVKGGEEFERRPRVAGGPPYIDRRCRTCRWARMAASPGR